ncbi:hypothetical protein ACWDUM_03115 [Rhodococcus sp. NPDC003322]
MSRFAGRRIASAVVAAAALAGGLAAGAGTAGAADGSSSLDPGSFTLLSDGSLEALYLTGSADSESAASVLGMFPYCGGGAIEGVEGGGMQYGCVLFGHYVHIPGLTPGLS